LINKITTFTLNTAEPDPFSRLIGQKTVVIGFSLLLSLVILTYYTNRQVEDAQEWQIHTHEVQKKIGHVLSLMQDLETGQRGYLLTGEEQYLEPFNVAIGKVAQEVRMLRSLTADNPEQQIRIGQLEPLITDKITELKETIDLHQKWEPEMAIALVKSGSGKFIMDKIRVVLDEMDIEENRLLELRNQESKKLQGFVFFGYIIVVLTLIGLAYVVFMRTRNYISFQAKAKADLQNAKEMAEVANRTKSTFLANMSHEIRTPISAIVGMTEIIRHVGLTPEQVNPLNKLETASNHLLGIINAILDLSKIEAGKFALEETAVSVNAIVSNVVFILHEAALAKHLKLFTDIAPMPSRLLGDSLRLQQALLNYVSNAIKFTNHGHITLRAECLTEYDDSALLRFEVEDTGIGIEAETLSFMFDAFMQAEDSTTRKYGGTGLGLTITRRIAQLMGGNAGGKSTPGRGSIFWFTAHLKKDNHAADTTDSMSKPKSPAGLTLKHDYTDKRILLAEDDPINQEVATFFLKNFGLRMDVANDGVEAVRLANENAYDLILMDMQMPIMNGMDATRAIRALPSYARIPILAMTANAFTESKMVCLNAGMDDFLTKPVDWSDLHETLLRWFRRP